MQDIMPNSISSCRWAAHATFRTGATSIETVMVVSVAAIVLMAVVPIAQSVLTTSKRHIALLLNPEANRTAVDTIGAPFPTDPDGITSNSGSESPDQDSNDHRRTNMDDLLHQSGPLTGQMLEDAARTAALLSRDAYKSDVTDRSAPNGWEVVTRVNGQQGFAASVYRRMENGKEVVSIAFRGTEDSTDWFTNVFNAAFGSEQYIEAIKLTRHVQSEYPNAEIFLTGHSLGGGLASYASALTQLPAVVVNAAGPSYPHLLAIGSANLARELSGGDTYVNTVHVNTRRDPLTNSDAGQSWGEHVYVIQHPKAPSFDDFVDSPEVLLDAHGLDYVLQALESSQPLQKR